MDDRLCVNAMHSSSVRDAIQVFDKMVKRDVIILVMPTSGFSLPADVGRFVSHIVIYV